MGLFLDHVEQKLYESLIEKNQPLDEFSLLDAWGYLIEVAKEEKRVAGCIIKIERKGGRFNINQLMVNKRGEPLYSKGEFVLGHVWQSYDLDDSLYKIAKSKSPAKMSLESLELRVKMEVAEDE